ncbi:MAG: hypothetical protein K9G62_07575 [Alphaproteobacteria bacterium]|nr:hypothetical protein [Alphaproteobacteria bacterium]
MDASTYKSVFLTAARKDTFDESAKLVSDLLQKDFDLERILPIPMGSGLAQIKSLYKKKGDVEKGTEVYISQLTVYPTANSPHLSPKTQGRQALSFDMKKPQISSIALFDQAGNAQCRIMNRNGAPYINFEGPCPAQHISNLKDTFGI